MTKRNLGNWLRAYMEFTRETESPDQYHFWVACSLISAATRRQIKLNMNQFEVYPNLYVILVGPSGARKSNATAIGMKIASKVGIRKFADKITGAALLKDLSEATIKFVSPTEVTLCSPILIYSSELGVFLGTDAYHTGVIADLTDLYDCPSQWEKKTIIRESEIIVAPYVSVLAASTPQTLKDVLPIEAVGQGFTSRIIFVWGKGRRKKVPIPTWGPEYEMLQNNLVADLKTIMTIRGQFEFSPDGWECYRQFYMNQPEPEEEFQDEKLRGYASRKATHILKLAMIVSLSDKNELVLTQTDIQSAIDGIKWMEEGLGDVFAGHGRQANSQDVVRVWRQIETGSKAVGYVSHSELMRRNFHNLSAHDLASVLETLKQAKSIEDVLAKDPRTGRMEYLYKIATSDKDSLIKKTIDHKPSNLKED